ncbi:protein rolling stone-like [Tubulanus polymorphus]|uniref:protein rolling stone-like n=1 Tax=Tubulanus polymorphus TaxID=672921 RepID=UPI003DA67922
MATPCKLRLLYHDGDKNDFVTAKFACSWIRRSRQTCLWLAWRVCVAGLFSLSLFLSIFMSGDWLADGRSRATWLIYLTNWSFAVLTLSQIMRAVDVWLSDLNILQSRGSNLLPWTYKVTWIVHEVAMNAALNSTFLYWASGLGSTSKMDELDVFTHGIHAFIISFHLIISATPVRCVHVFFSLIYYMMYGAFTFVYQYCGGLNAKGEPLIYPFLDWEEKPIDATLMMITVLSFAFVFQAFFVFLCYIRDKLHDKICPRPEFERGPAIIGLRDVINTYIAPEIK